MLSLLFSEKMIPCKCSTNIIPGILYDQELAFDNQMSKDPPLAKDIEEENVTKKDLFNFEDMTSEEIALWIDMKARIVFPVLFLIFNFFYWLFAYIDY